MQDPGFKSILVPIDFSDMTGQVIDQACFIAKAFNSRMTMIYVIHVPPLAEAGTWLDPLVSPSVEQDINRNMQETAKKKLEELTTKCSDLAIETDFIIKSGVPFDKILMAAEEIKADLIIMGSQGRTGLSHFLIGSVAERVLRRAHCTVMVVKPQKQEVEE